MPEGGSACSGMRGQDKTEFAHGRERETTFLQFEIIDDQAPILHVKGFKTGAIPVDEKVYISTTHILLHMIMHKAGERVKAFSHATWIRIQPVAHRVVQVKHGLARLAGLVTAVAQGQCPGGHAGSRLRGR